MPVIKIYDGRLIVALKNGQDTSFVDIPADEFHSGIRVDLFLQLCHESLQNPLFYRLHEVIWNLVEAARPYAFAFLNEITNRIASLSLNDSLHRSHSEIFFNLALGRPACLHFMHPEVWEQRNLHSAGAPTTWRFMRWRRLMSLELTFARGPNLNTMRVSSRSAIPGDCRASLLTDIAGHQIRSRAVIT